jgi:beta-phosphoglucomutase-like phosphatase (HAD superfamily)
MSEEVRAAIDRFYVEVFPSLSSLTKPLPGAVRMVEQALASGYHLAVTTNPLFPRAAVLERLAWAGLPADQYPFELITSYETSHFSKPSPVYFAEVLGRLGWPDRPVVVIGDDIELDISAARQLGLAAFWVAGEDQNVPDGKLPPTHQGSIEGVIPWLKQISPEELQIQTASTDALLALLRATPAVLGGQYDGIPAHLLAERPEPGEWSLVEIQCHLRDVEKEVNLPRLRKMFEQANPFLPGMDTDPWAEQRQYIQQEGRQAWQDFTSARMESLTLLETASAEDWQKPARHAILGPTRLEELVRIISSHDRMHIQQFAACLKAIR